MARGTWARRATIGLATLVFVVAIGGRAGAQTTVPGPELTVSGAAVCDPAARVEHVTWTATIVGTIALLESASTSGAFSGPVTFDRQILDGNVPAVAVQDVPVSTGTVTLTLLFRFEGDADPRTATASVQLVACQFAPPLPPSSTSSVAPRVVAQPTFTG